MSLWYNHITTLATSGPSQPGKCAICKCMIADACVNCVDDGVECDDGAVYGECGHGFHACCMERWLQTRKVCPLDNVKWKPV